ncbi:MAG: LPS export ABC transporter periplasmic protein LptC [Desulforhopalus sp.]
MKFHRNTIWLIPLLLIVTFPLWSIPVGNFLTPRGGFDPVLKNEKTDTHNFNMDTVKILQNQEGRKTAVIRAQKARTGEDPNLIIMEMVDADLYDKDGYLTKINAKTGKYSMTTKILTLANDVVVNKTRDKQFLYTDLLLYDSERQIVRCPGRTRLEGESVEIKGGSLVYNINNQTYVIDKRVNVIINGFIQP